MRNLLRGASVVVGTAALAIGLIATSTGSNASVSSRAVKPPSAALPGVVAASCFSGSGSTGNSSSQGGTVFVKSSGSTCQDFNVTYTHDDQGFGNDFYRGALLHSNGQWVLCTKGWTFLNDGNHGIIPFCTNVAVGTHMKMDSQLDAPDTVHVLY